MPVEIDSNMESFKIYVSPFPKNELFSLYKQFIMALTPYQEACAAWRKKILEQKKTIM